MASETLVLVMTDVVASTRLWSDRPREMPAVMARHHAIVHAAVAASGGWRPVDQGEGDAVFAVFESASAAVSAVLDFQRRLRDEVWPEGIAIQDRVGVHIGEVIVRDGNLFGLPVARTARIRSLGAGGQVLLSAPVYELVRDALPASALVMDLGEHRMKDLARPERLYQLGWQGLGPFPPLASLNRVSTNLPIQSTQFFGRETEVAELAELVARERLVTIVGFGGMGKTRLALQVAAELGDGEGDGVWFVDLAAVMETERIPSEIAAAVGEERRDPEALLSWLRDRRMLLILDNLEQLLPDAAAFIDQIVSEAPDVHLLATSRQPIRIRSERVYALEPLALPPARDERSLRTEAEVGALGSYAAVSLFLERAAAARRDFELTPANAAAVAAICARLDGLPLALELAAARLRALSPEALLPRLENALKVLTQGSRDLPTRQQTLRATIAWSVDALTPDEQVLLARLSIFPATFDLAAAEEVAGLDADGHPDVDVLEGVTGLIDRSVLRLHPRLGAGEEDRYDQLVSVRDFARERLIASGQADAAADSHARWALGRADVLADRRDRGDESVFGEYRAEAESFDAAVRWLLDRGHDRVEDAKQLLLSAGPSYSRFAPADVYAARLRLVPLASLRGSSRDIDFLARAATVGMALGTQDGQRLLDLGFQLCARHPDASWSRRGRLTLTLFATDIRLLGADYDGGRLMAEQSLAEAHSLGLVEEEAHALNQLIDACEYDDTPEDGARWAQRYIDFTEEHQIVGRRINARVNLAFALVELGRVEEAARQMEMTAPWLDPVGNRNDVAWFKLIEGVVRLAQGDAVRAAASLDHADHLLSDTGFGDFQHRARQARVGLLALEGDRDGAQRLLADLVLPMSATFTPPPLPRTVRRLLAPAATA